LVRIVPNANLRITIFDLLRTHEQKNKKYGKDEEDEQNDAIIHRESINRRRIRHKGIPSLIRINLIFIQKIKEEAELSL